VKPATNTYQKPYLLKLTVTCSKRLSVNPGMYLKKKESTDCQMLMPIKYPIIPPIIEAMDVYKAKRQDFLMAPRHRAMRRGSGGMGKKELSARARRKRAIGP